MPILLSEDWMDSVADLTQSDYRRVNEFIKKFRENQANPGASLERITNAKDKNIWSARITQGLRAILHKDGDNSTLLYAGQHDDAYKWAETHYIQRNKITGALQVVSVVHIEDQIKLPNTNLPCLFDKHEDAYLLSLGLPESWLPTIRKVYSDETLYEFVDKLPVDVAERLLDLATGQFVTPPIPVPLDHNPFESEDTRRRFVLLDDNSEILRALDAPLAKWVAFLHPSQKRIAEGSYNGPVKVSGSAGTGKTIVAMHRARHLARCGKRVLLTSYVNTLCQNIRSNLQLFCDESELSKITVGTVHSQARDILAQAGESVKPLGDIELSKWMDSVFTNDCPLDRGSLQSEWENVIQAQAIRSWEQYRDASRRGRGRALNAKERKLVWSVFEKLFFKFKTNNVLDWSSMCLRAKELIDAGKVDSRYDSVIVDEVQDLRPLELMFIASLARGRKDNLMLIGDSGQRIYASKTTLKSLGIDVRGRAHVLRINYRTTEHIRRFADHLRIVSSETDDVDENQNAKSLIIGHAPVLKGFTKQEDEYAFISEKVQELKAGQIESGEIAIFVRTTDLVERLKGILERRGIACTVLTRDTDFSSTDSVFLGTMHRAKGLEFKAVFVAHASGDVIPSPYLLNVSGEPNDSKDSIDRERQLMYVSITRARDDVYITWTGSQSPFLPNRDMSAAVSVES